MSNIDNIYLPLDKNELKPNATECRVAMVKRVAVNRDKNGQYYLSVVLKDKAGKVVYGNLFEYDGGEGARKEIEQMIDRAVKVTYTSSVYKGRITLSIDRMAPIPVKDAVILEKTWFRSEYPDVRAKQCTAFIEKSIDAIQIPELRSFVKQRFNPTELQDCADSHIMDGMTGAALGIICSMCSAANGLYATQPGMLTAEDYATLIATIVYLESTAAMVKPLYTFGVVKWQTQLIDQIRSDRMISESLVKTEAMHRFFEVCENAAWMLADVNVVHTLIGQLYYNLKMFAENSFRVINITNNVPEEAVITVGSKSYTR